MLHSVFPYRVIITLCLVLVMGCTKKETPRAPEPTKAAVEANQAEDKAKSENENAKIVVNLKTIGERYGKEARALIAGIDNKATSETIKSLGAALTQTGLAMIPFMTEKYPVCAPYFAALTKATKTFESLSLETIEKDYHQDGKLPKSPDGSCYHGKDLVVHPATVVIMAKAGITTEEQQKAASRNEEVLAHLSAVMQ